MGSKKEQVTKVKGQIGELGPHVIKADHTAYDYIRMDVDGQIIMVRDVRVSQTIDSYLKPEMDVTLFVHGGDRQGNNGLVVGARSNVLVFTSAFYFPFLAGITDACIRLVCL